ncbi:MAG: 16S rRNA processing protein RimM [Candidatus Caenarcaniphilales bacterium]|nr:16S rRNA processing protein RimM [Candidatus Caenarcaniphilales bacterium]
MPEPRVIANICGCHGIKGELKLYPLMDSIEEFYGLQTVLIQDKEYKVDSVRPNKQFILMKLKEITNRNMAEELDGYVSALINEELEEGEFFMQDLINLKVLDSEGKELGKVNNFTETGQTLIFIKLNKEFNKKNDLLIPFVERYINKIDIKEKCLYLNEISELIELNK